MKKIIALILLIFTLMGCTKSHNPQELYIIGPSYTKVGEVVTMKTNLKQAIIWTSSSPNIATIDKNGLLTGLSAGTTEITAQLQIDEKIKASLVFSVFDNNEQIPHINPYYLYYHTKINHLELLNVPYTEYIPNVKVSQYLDGKLIEISFSNLTIGMENVYVAVNQNTDKIESIIVNGNIGFRNIRVAIRHEIDDIANDKDIYHDDIALTPNGEVSIQTFDGTKKINIPYGAKIDINVVGGLINVTDGNVTLITNKRVIIFNNNQISVTSIIRNRFRPVYDGNLEISLVGSRLLLVNDVNIESYLTKVVPSEMPPYFHDEALKAQAVAARTYAYKDIFNRTYLQYGYTVDDSTKSQVYNNQRDNVETTSAVDATKGLIMTNNDEPITAFYYSTSSGLTASSHEVWITSRTLPQPNPYLMGQNHTKLNDEVFLFDPSNEDNMLNFFKTIKLDTPDSGSLFHRWNTTMTASQIRETLQTNLPITYEANSELVLTKVGDNWESLPIPDSIGEVMDVYVSRRGESGVVIELDIVTTTGTYKIINQYSIRFSIRPRDAGSLRATNTDDDYSNTVDNISILYSGFFAIEKIGDSYLFYGGGNGHGVGMSQYGANGLGEGGLDYEEILYTYYSDIELFDISYNYHIINNYQELLSTTLDN